MKLAQLLGAEHRQPLAGVEDERDAGRGELLGMRDHALAAIGRDDADADVGGVAHCVAMREAHRARMECGDLVVVKVGGDEGLAREGAVDHGHVRAVDAALVHPPRIGAEVLAHRAHGHGAPAEELEVVGDVAGAAAELAAHLRHEEGHVQHVDLVREDVVLEAVARTP